MHVVPKLVILAAGNSSRMGSPKGLLHYKESTLIEYNIKVAQSVGIEEIYCVTGRDHEIYSSSLGTTNVTLLHNANHHLGQFSSFMTAITSISTENGILFSPVDTLFHPEVLSKLLNESRFAPELIHIPTYKAKKGHPIYIGTTLISRLTHDVFSYATQRLDLLINEYEHRLHEWEYLEITYNFNTSDEWNKIVE